MAKGKAMIDYEKCLPERCDKGICAAVDSCSHRVFIQEIPYEAPYILQDFCTGCGKCVAACPLRAIEML